MAAPKDRRSNGFDQVLRKIKSAKNNDDRLGVLIETVEPLGFSVVVVCQLVSDILRKPRPFFYSNWIEGWQAHYATVKMADRDVLSLLTRRAQIPFLWSEVEADPDGLGVSLEGVGGIREVRSFSNSIGKNWEDGFIVPVRGAFGYYGAVSYWGRPRNFAGDTRLRLEAVSGHAHWIMFNAHQSKGDTVTKARDHHELTDRQLEILQCVIGGMTDVRTAKQLGITERTVLHHVTQARRKLGCSSRAQLISTVHNLGIL